MSSHCDGEVWGVSLVPNDPTKIVSVADDNSLRVWDTRDHRQVAVKILEAQPGPQRRAGEGASTLASNTPKEQARAVCINPTNNHVAVGHNDGHY
mmetsp:Transcript_8781/g.1230  ORF Transcript_8781/g.1230 Transcript_8781/m.1230 type:complete len:95 (+) Transcript_8781:1293-1577(+)